MPEYDKKRADCCVSRRAVTAEARQYPKTGLSRGMGCTALCLGSAQSWVPRVSLLRPGKPKRQRAESLAELSIAVLQFTWSVQGRAGWPFLEEKAT
jgi:hypothetical protein